MEIIQIYQIRRSIISEKEYDSILDEAKDITGGDRMDLYGHPKKNFKRIADLWTAYLCVEINERDIGFMMILLKISRCMNIINREGILDIAGYARNISQVEGWE